MEKKFIDLAEKHITLLDKFIESKDVEKSYIMMQMDQLKGVINQQKMEAKRDLEKLKRASDAIRQRNDTFVRVLSFIRKVYTKKMNSPLMEYMLSLDPNDLDELFAKMIDKMEDMYALGELDNE